MSNMIGRSGMPVEPAPRPGRWHGLLRACLGLALGVTVTLGSAASVALADSSTATATVSAGSLSESTTAAPSIADTLNGTDQTVTYTLPMTVTDSTGSGNGWNVTITSTQFSTGGTTPHTLATSASSVTAVSATCAANTTCTAPTNSVTYPFTLPAGSTAPVAVKLFNAATSTGMGQFTVAPTVSVAIPANTYAGTYTSTVTLAIVSGP